MYILLALLGIGLLIFVHELGHLFVARWVGMRVEAFGIGFGKPIYSWNYKGIKWNLCWMPFGGYVKVAGMEKEGDIEPHDVPDGYFGKGPVARILVALAGPVANFLLAFLFFAIIWMTGGQEKTFTEFTHTIGWVDPQSELYADGVRPGDQISSYDGRPYQSIKDHIYAPLVAEDKIRVQGFKVNHDTGEKTPYDYTVKVYDNPFMATSGMQTAGILAPANYVIYDKAGNKENPLPEGSPLVGSGIQYGDRIYWIDGERIFSSHQLSLLLNDHKALLTIKRGDSNLLVRVPRVLIEELKIDQEHREELSDWQFQNSMTATKLPKLYFIPYNLNAEGVVEGDIKLIDQEHQQKIESVVPYSESDTRLQKGDRIVAVDGVVIRKAADIFKDLQSRLVNIIVERQTPVVAGVLWTKGDAVFAQDDHQPELNQIVQSIGTDSSFVSKGRLQLLKPITPKRRVDFAFGKDSQVQLALEMEAQRKQIEKIENTDKRTRALALLDAHYQEVALGIPTQDRKVDYNPGPITLFNDVVSEIWQTLSALVKGDLNPKWLAGPVGMVQMLQNRWMVSLKEALYWLAAISINLGVLNLLPIPVLDGGHICMALFELVTGRRIKAKTMERLIIPFVILLFGFMIFVTFHDLMRLFSRFLG